MVLRILILIGMLSISYGQTSGDIEIDSIVITGNKFASSETLLKFIRSKEGDNFRNYLANSDQIVLSNFYQSKGYLFAEVMMNFDRFSRKLTFRINENFRYFFSKLRFEGIDSARIELLSSFTDINYGDPYETERIRSWYERIKNYYYNNGKPQATIELNTVADKNRSFYNDIVISIQEGRTIYFRNILIQNQSETDSLRTQKKVILNEMEFKKGELYSEKNILESENYLFQTNIFQNIVRTNRLANNPDSLGNDSIDIEFSFLERKANYISLSGGLSNDKFQYDLTFPTERGFFKRILYDVNIDIGKRNYQGSGNNVGIMYTPVWYYRTDEDFESLSNKLMFYTNFINFPFRRFYSNMEISYLLINHPTYEQLTRSQILFSTNYRFDADKWLDLQATFDNNVVKDSINNDTRIRLGLDDYNILSFSSNFRYDRRNNYTNPSSGFLMSLGVKGSDATKINSKDPNTSYFTLSGEWRRYQTFLTNQDLIFASNLKIAGILSFDHSKDSIKYIPKTDRLYSGQSNRAFDFNLLGPLEQIRVNDIIRYEAIGGRLLFVSNFDLRYRIGQFLENDVYLLGFMDITGLWAEYKDISFKELRSGYGFGLSYYIQLLIIRFDIGFKIDPGNYRVEKPFTVLDKESTYNFNFGLSYLF